MEHLVDTGVERNPLPGAFPRLAGCGTEKTQMGAKFGCKSGLNGEQFVQIDCPHPQNVPNTGQPVGLPGVGLGGVSKK